MQKAAESQAESAAIVHVACGSTRVGEATFIAIKTHLDPFTCECIADADAIRLPRRKQSPNQVYALRRHSHLLKFSKLSRAARLVLRT